MHKIFLLGATGRTGIVFAKAALEQGFEIKALVRNPAKLAAFNTTIDIVTGNILDTPTVQAALQGCDTVVSLIGHVKATHAAFQAKAIEIVMEAMQQQHIQRIVILTGSGIHFKGDKRTMGEQLLTKLITAMAPLRISDGEQQCRKLMASQLSWTIVRVPLLTNSSEKPAKINPTVTIYSHVSRKTACSFILHCIRQHAHVQQAPIICT